MDHINFLLLLVDAAFGSKHFKFEQLVQFGWRGIKLSGAIVNFAPRRADSCPGFSHAVALLTLVYLSRALSVWEFLVERVT